MLNKKIMILFLLAGLVSCTTIKYQEIQPPTSSTTTTSLNMDIKGGYAAADRHSFKSHLLSF